MPTSTFNLPNAAFRLSGLVFQNASTTHMDGQGTQYGLLVTGTAASMLVSSEGGGAISASITVDGSTNTVSIPGGSYQSVTIFTGLADAQHTVSIKSTGSGSTSIAWSNANALSVTGSAPAIAAPTTPAAQTVLNAMGSAVVFGGKITKTTGGGASYSYFDGTFSQVTFNDQAVVFRGTGASLNVFGLLNGFGFRITIDGVDQPLGTVPNTGNFGWATLASGLDSTSEHQYQVWITATPNGVTSLYSISMGPGGSVNTSYSFTAANAIKTLAVMGDSIAAGSQLTDTGQAFPHLLALKLKRVLYNAGIPSSTVGNEGVSPMRGRTSDLSGGAGGTADILINQGGTNDAAQASATLQPTTRRCSPPSGRLFQTRRSTA